MAGERKPNSWKAFVETHYPLSMQRDLYWGRRLSLLMLAFGTLGWLGLGSAIARLFNLNEIQAVWCQFIAGSAGAIVGCGLYFVLVRRRGLQQVDSPKIETTSSASCNTPWYNHYWFEFAFGILIWICSTAFYKLMQSFFPDHWNAVEPTIATTVLAVVAIGGALVLHSWYRWHRVGKL